MILLVYYIPVEFSKIVIKKIVIKFFRKPEATSDLQYQSGESFNVQTPITTVRFEIQLLIQKNSIQTMHQNIQLTKKHITFMS